MESNLIQQKRLATWGILLALGAATVLSQCKKEDPGTPGNNTPPKFTMQQTLSDGAQRNTIAFDALGFMVGNAGAQTFFPPGKVADYSGFQYLRDNDPTNLGHNTSFVTIIAFNVLDILSEAQIQMLVDAAEDQVPLINSYAYKRYPMCVAFRRLLDGDLPAGTTQLDPEVVQAFCADLYKIDGEISYNRAQLFGQLIASLSSAQISQLNSLVTLNGVGYWNANLSDPLKDRHLTRDVNVAVMTYASEMYAWYAGSVDADVYFCPERQGTYFGSFYLKDWPAMGNPNYTINEQLTASAGQDFLNLLTKPQSDKIVELVTTQRADLEGIVAVRTEISTSLRQFLTGGNADKNSVLALSADYGTHDGHLAYLYAVAFAEVYQSMSAEQKSSLAAMADALGYVEPEGGFLYSSPIPMPQVENTDYFFK